MTRSLEGSQHMVWEIASTTPLYAKVGVILVVLVVGGYWMARQVMASRCGCTCCLGECLDCIRSVEHSLHNE